MQRSGRFWQWWDGGWGRGGGTGPLLLVECQRVGAGGSMSCKIRGDSLVVSANGLYVQDRDCRQQAYLVTVSVPPPRHLRLVQWLVQCTTTANVTTSL